MATDDLGNKFLEWIQTMDNNNFNSWDDIDYMIRENIGGDSPLKGQMQNIFGTDGDKKQ